jgi:phospholipase/carboxylesterase
MGATNNGPHGQQPIRHAGAPLTGADAALILLHGRGGAAGDILALGDELAGDGVALLAPEAADHTWYPDSFMAPFESNEPWLSSALGVVGRTLGRAERAGVARRRIVLAGFSQGACLACEYVGREAPRLAALIAFTGGRIGPPGTFFGAAGELDGMPVYLSAGDPDPHVPWARVEETRVSFERMGATVTLRRLPGRPHTILRQEVDEARQIVAAALSVA